MRSSTIWKALFLSLIILSFVLAGPPAEAGNKKPNILSSGATTSATGTSAPTTRA